MLAETKDIVFVRSKKPGTVVIAQVVGTIAVVNVGKMCFETLGYKGLVIKTGSRSEIIEFQGTDILDVLRRER